VGERRLEIRVACNTPSFAHTAFTNHLSLSLNLAASMSLTVCRRVSWLTHFVEGVVLDVISAGELNLRNRQSRFIGLLA